MRRRSDLADKQARLAIAQAIQEFLHAAGQSRKVLIDREPRKLSESTVNKVFQGEFSERTLTMIEAMLGRSFGARKAEPERAASKVGGYGFEAAAALEGEYLCVRPVFGHASSVSAYAVHIKWDSRHNKLVFEEHGYADAKQSEAGSVELPFGLPFMYLVSTNRGNVRTIVVSLPDPDGLCRGMILTLNNSRGVSYVPVCAPIVLQRLAANEPPHYGIVTPADAAYAGYRDKLASVTAEEFAAFVTLSDTPSERRALTVAGA